MMPTLHSPSRRSVVLLSAPALLTLILCCGCGSTDEERLPVYPVSGLVTVGGKPAENALVVFHPQTEMLEGLRPSGRTAADGKFSLSTYEGNDGAPAGQYRVTIVLPVAPTGPNPDRDLAADQLKGRYANPSTSKLQAQVEEGKNELPTFALR